MLFKLYSYSTISNDWKIQPDAIAEVQFKKTPNVYYIQADGYVNFSEMDKGFYQYDNSPFKSYLEQNGFKNYANFRSNYPTTLESNASTFMMKHHFFNNSLITGEIYNSRNTIISKNTVLDVFNNNGYKTYFVSETPYMLLNRPKMGYDVSNIAYSEIAYLNNGIGKRRDIVEPVLNLVSQEINSPKFFFVQILKPWHIHSRKRHTLYKEKERLAWLESLEEANVILKELVSEILKKDPDALLIITADHGGYVGMDYTDQTIAKSQNRDFIYSIFSSQLSIRWPNNEAPTYDAHFASSVNLFRILFSYLSNNEAYLEYLQEDSSYTIIREGAPEGIYKYIDHDGHIVFEGINATD
ncbi:MAG: LTA synthase family protein [Altibacter sp.]|uniref:sulfatase-like hydrolase/transferase n=1 Tax=Altibacter sp. TaxID=2024823 RepID=UPI001D31F1C3|nr:sulfatase-like hydrolase/transferase [Altibacter sp.]MBZ0328395.1 LTA synthase family protein [Altibacter sp.]